MAIKKSDLYSSLWASCDALRGGMDASQYKDYVLTLLFVKYISDKFKNQKFGHLVAISSIAGIRGNRQATSYFATKAYQINYLEGLRQKVNKLKMKIYLTDVRPGFVKTEMTQGEGLFWVASVEKASKQIYNAISKKRKIVYVTKRWGIIATILKRIPNFIYDKM